MFTHNFVRSLTRTRPKWGGSWSSVAAAKCKQPLRIPNFKYSIVVIIMQPGILAEQCALLWSGATLTFSHYVALCECPSSSSYRVKWVLLLLVVLLCVKSLIMLMQRSFIPHMCSGDKEKTNPLNLLHVEQNRLVCLGPMWFKPHAVGLISNSCSCCCWEIFLIVIEV